MAEWSIARGCRPRGFVPAGVRIPPPGQMVNFSPQNPEIPTSPESEKIPSVGSLHFYQEGKLVNVKFTVEDREYYLQIEMTDEDIKMKRSPLEIFLRLAAGEDFEKAKVKDLPFVLKKLADSIDQNARIEKEE